MWFDENLDDLPAGKKIYDRQMLKRMLPLLKPFKMRILGGGLILVVSSGLGLLPPLLLKRSIDVNIAGSDFNGLLITVGLYVLLQLATFGVNYLMLVVLESLGVRIVSALKEQLFGHMLGLDIAYFDQHPVGRLIARVESDTEAIRRLFTSTMFTVLGAVVSLAGMIFIMIKVSLPLFLAISTLVPVIFLLTILFQKKVRPLFLVVRKKYAEIVAYLTEMVQGMKVIQAFSRENAVKQKMAQLNRSYIKTLLPADVLTMGFFSLVGVFEIIGLAIILTVGGNMVAQGLLTIGAMVLFLGYLRQFFMPVYAFSEQVGIMQRAFAAAQRVFEIMDIEPQVINAASGGSWDIFKNSIEFQGVDFSYVTRAGNDEPDWVLRDINFTITKGEKIALVGATGGGKSSIINLMLRFYDPQAGRISIDGIDIREISLDKLRRHFGLVLQDVFLFPGTVRENLTLGAEMTKEQLDRAVEILGLQRILDKMPSGLDSELAERGANLSQGERQLVSFARALAFDPQILILDEATSSVDPMSERLIQQGIKRLLEGRTAVIVAHRLSTILDADKIMVVHKGRIVESGRHSELLEKNGYYAKLYRIQFA
ncbi:MAG: ABC transporter ATP-binding protein [Candidatus Edwardsbacteria bacterium]|nr:ABC transporter ATP-binding protein [Candidatus Edwardsbacteria bacterium]